MAAMTREEQQMEKRLLDLGRTAYERGIVTYSDFLNLNELNIYHKVRPQLSYIQTTSFGGYELAERQMVAFIPDALVFCPEYPFVCLKLIPLQEKFAEALSHRDYLGAVLNLGIDRSKLGDILIKEKQAYLFCHQKLGDFICENLTRVRHTAVLAKRTEEQEVFCEPEYQEIKGTVASIRLDSLLSLAFQASRSSLCALIEGGRVFVNGKLITSNGYQPREEDIVSVRGMGRFRIKEAAGKSKKGRLYVTIWKYC